MSMCESILKAFILIEIDTWSIVGNLKNPRWSTNQDSASDKDGNEANQHDQDLEHICPDDRFHTTLR